MYSELKKIIAQAWETGNYSAKNPYGRPCGRWWN